MYILFHYFELLSQWHALYYYISAAAAAAAVAIIIIISAFLCFISHLQLSAFCTRAQIEHDEHSTKCL